MSFDSAQNQKVFVDGMPVNAFEINAGKKKPERFIVPAYFKNYFRPNEEAMKYWEYQLRLAKQGAEFTLPNDRMRMPESELHQLMAKSF